LREWHIRQDERKQGIISDREYFEWKINWPRTCDDGGKFEPRYKWRVVVEGEGCAVTDTADGEQDCD